MSHQPNPLQQPRPDTPSPQKAKGKGGKVAGFGCLGIIAIIVIAIAVSAATDDGKPLNQSAAVMCEQFVKDRLKSPGSAEFPGVTSPDYAKTTTLHDTKPWKYKVTGVVDSQNSFGAKVRTNYVCTVSTSDDKNWHLDDIQLTQR